VDSFILAELEKNGLEPTADAQPAELIRRLYFDLIGLPPRSQEVIDFVAAYARDPDGTLASVVDRLLATPQFGERWGRHWLDVARYAESSGKDVNAIYPHAWRYRDWVIQAVNADLPFDQFLTHQIAGDLLPAADAATKAAQQIATGFLALGTKGLNEQNRVQFALDLADEQIDAVSTAFLATTVACARCHDHKQDPIPQKEYYALAGIFLSTDTRYGTAFSIQNRHATELISLPVESGVLRLPRTLSPEELTAKEKELAELREEFASLRRGAPGEAGTDQQRRLFLIVRIGQMEAELKSFGKDGQANLLCMGTVDQSGPPERPSLRGGEFRRRLREFGGRPAEFQQVTDSPFYHRGDATKPGDKVPRGFLSVLSKSTPPSIPAEASGRLQLAQWMVSSEAPLTARVAVNRVWHHLFGRGLVASVDNFGTSGQKPSHPELLDFLALRFQKDLGWSRKKLLRELILSRTYRQASTYDAKKFAADPENALLWRHSPQRLDAEAIRDAMLAVSGKIERRAPIGSTLAYGGDGIIGGPGGPLRRGIPEEALINPQGHYRSVYLSTARTLVPEALEVFDMADSDLVTGKRESTNVPTQALFLLNSPFVAEQSRAFAEKLLAAYPSKSELASPTDQFTERIRWAYGLCFSRWPLPEEMAAAQEFLINFPKDKSQPSPAQALEAWTSLCRALFASGEFRSLP
jgi:hypothetical protein